MARMKEQKWRGKEAEMLVKKPARKSRLLCSSSLQGPKQEMNFEHIHQSGITEEPEQ